MTVLSLSSRGDSLQLYELDYWDQRNPILVDTLEDKLTPEQIAKLKSATESKTHAAVLEFLEFAKEDPTISNPFFKLIHLNHPNYMGHKASDRNYHEDTLDKMISYVRQRIERDKTPHRIFDKIGRRLGPIYSSLRNGASIPLLGSIPAAMRSMLGAVQMVCGLALSILAAVPAYFSENAKIVLQRSAKHIGYGFLNMTVGALETIPGVGLFTQHNFPPPKNYGLR